MFRAVSRTWKNRQPWSEIPYNYQQSIKYATILVNFSDLRYSPALRLLSRCYLTIDDAQAPHTHCRPVVLQWSTATLPELIKTSGHREQSSPELSSFRKFNCREHIAVRPVWYTIDFGESTSCAWRIYLLVTHGLQMKEVPKRFSCNSHVHWAI